MYEIASNFRRVGERFIEAGLEADRVFEELLPIVAGDVEQAFIPYLMMATPVSTGALQASTTGEVEAEGLQAIAKFRQPAVTGPNWDGSGGGVPYVDWVIEGRGPIEAPSDGEYGTGKMALYGWMTDFGPVRSVGPAAGYDYRPDAIDNALPSIDVISGSGGQIMAREIARML